MMGLVVFTLSLSLALMSLKGSWAYFYISYNAFYKTWSFGQVLAVMFFVALFFAGLTSAVSMIEPFTFYLINRFEISRKRALVYIGVAA